VRIRCETGALAAAAPQVVAPRPVQS
jgi:hypothetical protein